MRKQPAQSLLRLAAAALLAFLAACSSLVPDAPEGSIRGWPQGREGSIKLVSYYPIYLYTYGDYTHYDYSYPILATLPVSSSGAVDLRLPPQLLDTETHPYLAQVLCTGGTSTLAVSDSNARFAVMVPFAYVGNSLRGVVVPSRNAYLLPLPLGLAVGDQMAAYLYSTRSVRVTGQCNKNAQYGSYEQRFTYDLQLFPGWNYVVGELTALNPITVTVRAASTLPAGMPLTLVPLSLGYDPISPIP